MTDRPLTQYIKPLAGPLTLEEYERAGGYTALHKAIKSMTPGEVCDEVQKSGLRGLGGAGFPTGTKWKLVPQGGKGPAPIAVMNADEMEPGTFKDRLLLEGNPHAVIESILLQAYAIGAPVAVIFLRWAYKEAAKVLTNALAEARTRGYVAGAAAGAFKTADVQLHISAGRYMCGEETGLLNALEGQRARPRSKPPFPQQSGFFGRPTVVNNVETLAFVPHIINNGANWFKGLGRNGAAGTKIYGVSGRVMRPGLWELPMGTTAGEIISEHAGGMQAGYRLRGFLPGGASTDFLTDAHLDIPLDFESAQKAGSRLGTGTMIILDDKTCPVGMVHNLELFFARESCGWCTPCRDGVPWVRSILSAIESGNGQEGDLDRLDMQCRQLAPGRTFCAFAPGAVEPLQSALHWFRDDFTRHIREKKCTYK